MKDVLTRKTSFILSGHMPLNAFYNSLAIITQWLETKYFYCALKQSYLFQVALQMKEDPHCNLRVNMFQATGLFHY